MFSNPEIEVQTPKEDYKVEIADSFLSKFMGFRFCSEGKMLFTFSRETNPGIDMMFVPETLYLYFIDSDKKVMDSKKAKPWRIDPRTWKLYKSSQNYRYLLESFEELELNKGDQLEFEV